MSRPQSKRDLAEAGRRKLEAFRAQKAAAKAFKDAPASQPASSLQKHRNFVAVSTAGPGNTVGSDLLSRAPSVLPLSTHAGPISYGGSDEEAPDNRKLLTHQAAPADTATAQSVPTYAVSSAPEPSISIPLTGRDSTGSTDSSSTQQTASQSAGAAAVPATSKSIPLVPLKYQSRLPPPPPVFKPPVRSHAGSVQSCTSDKSGSVHTFSPVPFRPAVQAGATKAVSSSGQDQAGQAHVRRQVQMFHPAEADSSSPGGQQPAAPPSSSATTFATAVTTSVTAATTAGRPAGSHRHAWSLFGSAQLTKEPTAATAAAASDDVSSEAAARLSPAQEASQLTLVNERQVLPQVSTEWDAEKTGRSEPGKMPHVSQSSGMVSPVSEQMDGNPPDSRSKKAVLPAFPESPDSPLVFPWSQGPSSTGAASAYASLSDSYLSRAPSQTPSQAPSQAPTPSKQGQLATPAAASPVKHAQHETSRLPTAKHAQQEPAGVSSSTHCAQSTVGSPSQNFTRPLDLTWGASARANSSLVHQSDSPIGQVGSPLGPLRAFQALPNGQDGSPSGPPLPTGHAFQSQSSGPLSNGPVSVAPWRQQPPSAISTTARLPSPLLGSPAATARVQPPQLRSPAATAMVQPPQLGSSGTTSTLQISPGKLPPSEVPHHVTGQGQQPTKQALEVSGDHAMMESQQSGAAAQHDTDTELPRQQQRPSSNGLPQLNGGRNSHDGAASSASSDSSFAPASATAGAAVQELERRNGSMHTLQKGMGSHTSLAGSLVNGTLPAKTSNFMALQQHIDDLTEEKFELVRGLQEQQKMAASLAEENQLVTGDFNRQAEALQQTRMELSQLEEEVREQLVAMEQLTAERDACKSGAHEASDRSKSLAAEVVALEEKVLQTRSREIRLQKGTASLQEGLQQAEKQLQASRRDRFNLQSTIDMLQEEKGALLAKLRQAASHPHDFAAAPGQRQPDPATHEASQQAQLAQAPLSNDLQQTAAVDQAAAAVHAADIAPSTSSQAMANRQTVGSGMSTSARLVKQILDRRRNQPEQFGATALQDALPQSLTSLLPASPAGDEGAVIEEQQQLLQSIHAMISNLEAEKQSYLGTLNSSQAELQDLRSANSELQRKLESQTQRLELAIQQQAHASPHAFSPSSSYSAQRSRLQSGLVSGQPNPQLWPNSPVLSAALQQQQQQPLPQGESALQLQSEEQQQQQQQQSYLHPAGYARSAPPTPQHEETRKSLRLPAEGRPSGVLGWLGNMIAPRPQPHQQELII